jgi:hypothetical protein
MDKLTVKNIKKYSLRIPVADTKPVNFGNTESAIQAAIGGCEIKALDRFCDALGKKGIRAKWSDITILTEKDDADISEKPNEVGQGAKVTVLVWIEMSYTTA